jgi:(R,R)-butanediol dehydrogenase/meso-butanediol dehydrogenase/diacetyl reductase
MGVDIAFEFAGNEMALDAAVRSTVRTGTITVGSLNEDPYSVEMNDIVNTERTVVGTNCYGFPPRSFRTEVDDVIQSLAAGDINTDAFVTGRLNLEEIEESGFKELLGDGSEQVKLLFTPQ